MKQLGLSEDLLNEALKIGIRTMEVDCFQLMQRVKSIDETWNTPAISALDGESTPDKPEPELERSSSLDVAEQDFGAFSGIAPELRPGDAPIGPGQLPSVLPDIANIEVSRDAEF